jgi:hypothetical protein
LLYLFSSLWLDEFLVFFDRWLGGRCDPFALDMRFFFGIGEGLFDGFVRLCVACWTVEIASFLWVWE